MPEKRAQPTVPQHFRQRQCSKIALATQISQIPCSSWWTEMSTTALIIVMNDMKTVLESAVSRAMNTITGVKNGLVSVKMNALMIVITLGKGRN